MDGIKNAPPSEEKAITKALAEFADGDSIAAHIASGNQYFCTRDQARSAGSHSVFSTTNRQWLQENYSVIFVPPEDLADVL